MKDEAKKKQVEQGGGEHATGPEKIGESAADKNETGENAALARVVSYMKSHWASDVPAKWQVGLSEYAEILPKVFRDFTEGATRKKQMLRIAGVSGSGKTTQLLPAAEKYFEIRDLKPVLVAARRFVTYHPHYAEILDEYGEAKVRSKTDEFSTIMLFLTMSELTKKGYDIILDVTLLDTKIEAILIQMLADGGYNFLLFLIAISPEIAEQHLAGRSWRHTKATEEEFIRATTQALEFYGAKCPEMKTVIWNTYEEEPVYDGAAKKASVVFQKYSLETEVSEHEEEALRGAKLEYIQRKLH